MTQGSTQSEDDGSVADVRDQGGYSARNSSKGALLHEAGLVFGALADGLSISEVREAARGGRLLQQRTRTTRERIWDALHHRYLAHRVGWIISDLIDAGRAGPHDPTFVSLLYLHYALSDRLTYDFVTGFVWNAYAAGQLAVAREDVLNLLDVAADGQPRIRRWSEKSRIKLSGSILTALRDFGLLEGTQKKRIARPPLPTATISHIARLLTGEGVSDSEIAGHLTWRLFLMSRGELSKASLNVSRTDRELQQHLPAGRFVLPTAWAGGSAIASNTSPGGGHARR